MYSCYFEHSTGFRATFFLFLPSRRKKLHRMAYTQIIDNVYERKRGYTKEIKGFKKCFLYVSATVTEDG